MSPPCWFNYTGSMSQQINLRIVLLTFKLFIIYTLYLTDLLQTYTPSRSLRSSSAGLLALPAINVSTMGAKAFYDAALKIWYSLLLHIHILDSITEFKTALETHLLKLAYPLLLLTFYSLFNCINCIFHFWFLSHCCAMLLMLSYGWLHWCFITGALSFIVCCMMWGYLERRH